MHALNFLKDDSRPVRKPQKRLNLTILDVVKKEVMKLLVAGIIYPISDSTWVSPVQVVPKKSGITVVRNQDNELIPTKVANSWRFCIDYWRLNQTTCKDHFPLPFIDRILKGWQVNHIIAFLMVFQVTCIFILHQRTSTRPYSHVHSTHLPTPG